MRFPKIQSNKPDLNRLQNSLERAFAALSKQLEELKRKQEENEKLFLEKSTEGKRRLTQDIITPEYRQAFQNLKQRLNSNKIRVKQFPAFKKANISYPATPELTLQPNELINKGKITGELDLKLRWLGAKERRELEKANKRNKNILKNLESSMADFSNLPIQPQIAYGIRYLRSWHRRNWGAYSKLQLMDFLYRYKPNGETDEIVSAIAGNEPGIFQKERVSTNFIISGDPEVKQIFPYYHSNFPEANQRVALVKSLLSQVTNFDFLFWEIKFLSENENLKTALNKFVGFPVFSGYKDFSVSDYQSFVATLLLKFTLTYQNYTYDSETDTITNGETNTEEIVTDKIINIQRNSKGKITSDYQDPALDFGFFGQAQTKRIFTTDEIMQFITARAYRIKLRRDRSIALNGQIDYNSDHQRLLPFMSSGIKNQMIYFNTGDINSYYIWNNNKAGVFRYRINKELEIERLSNQTTSFSDSDGIIRCDSMLPVSEYPIYIDIDDIYTDNKGNVYLYYQINGLDCDQLGVFKANIITGSIQKYVIPFPQNYYSFTSPPFNYYQNNSSQIWFWDGVNYFVENGILKNSGGYPEIPYPNRPLIYVGGHWIFGWQNHNFRGFGLYFPDTGDFISGETILPNQAQGNVDPDALSNNKYRYRITNYGLYDSKTIGVFNDGFMCAKHAYLFIPNQPDEPVYPDHYIVFFFVPFSVFLENSGGYLSKISVNANLKSLSGVRASPNITREYAGEPIEKLISQTDEKLEFLNELKGKIQTYVNENKSVFTKLNQQYTEKVSNSQDAIRNYQRLLGKGLIPKHLEAKMRPILTSLLNYRKLDRKSLLKALKSL